MSSQNAASGPWTVARLLAWTREYFEKHRVESPRLCAEILLAHAVGCRRLELYTRHESVPPDGALKTFRAAVVEAAQGKPIAYLTGTKDFFSLTFEVSPDVLVPRPETEVLVERAIHLVRRSGANQPRILDVGTGSGCIAIALAKNLATARIHAVDVSEAALAVARRNAEKLGVADRVTFSAGDLFDACRDLEAATFDVIVSNPPYIGRSETADLPATVRDFEPHGALFAGDDGLEVLRRLVSGARDWLSPEGHLLVEVAYNQAERVCKLFRDAQWGDVTTYKDDLRHDRVVHGACVSTSVGVSPVDEGRASQVA